MSGAVGAAFPIVQALAGEENKTGRGGALSLDEDCKD
jgi:hypothetical protein